MLLSCGSSDEETDVIEEKSIIPTNLSINIIVKGATTANLLGDGSGIIDVILSAKDAVRYKVKFGDGNEIESTSGSISYTYTNAGTKKYTIEVIAFSKTGNFISDFVQKEIVINAGGSKLVWSDDFNVDGAPNTANWTYDLGAGGWGNNELQTYTKNSENVKVESGFLKITAKKNGSSYTSARLKSQGLRKFKYGKFEIKAKLPASKGTWPAIWMLGSNFPDVGWPNSGEIDIMEQKGTDKNTVLSTLHYPGNFAGNGPSKGTSLSTSTTQFHVYSVDWSSSKIEFAIDGNVFHTFTNNSNTPFNADFFFIFNIAMGGTLGGTVDANFTESSMEIDYIKVYQ